MEIEYLTKEAVASNRDIRTVLKFTAVNNLAKRKLYLKRLLSLCQDMIRSILYVLIIGILA